MNGLADSRYRVLGRVGRGRRSEVWLADKLGPEGRSLRTVALKAMLARSCGSVERRQRAALFEREITVNAQLVHRNVVRVDSWGYDLFGSKHFFEMERVRGLSLLGLLKRRAGPQQAWGALPPQDVAWIGEQAAAGLHYAHNHARIARRPARHFGVKTLTLEDESGVAHCDISPASIMVDVDGEVKVTDWGVAESLDAFGNASRTHTLLGRRIKYMPPEQMRGQVDVRGDIYSLGVTLTAALSGQDVFPSDAGSSWEFTAGAVLRGEREPVSTLAPNAPPALKDLLESMMHLDPEQRPRAHEVVDSFHAIAIQDGDRSDTVRQRFSSRVQEHHREPREPPRLRLLRGGRSLS